MNAINDFNKPILNELYVRLHTDVRSTDDIDAIRDLIDRIKVDDPIPIKTVEELDKKNMNKKIKKINKKNTPKATGWRLFCAHKSHELIDDPHSTCEKWRYFAALWEVMNVNGEDKYWIDLADQRNSEISDTL